MLLKYLLAADTWMEDSDVQPSDCPIDEAEAGMVMVARLEQFLKACSSTLLAVSGSIMDCSLARSWNIPYPMTSASMARDSI